jgi:hypothetical protein
MSSQIACHKVKQALSRQRRALQSYMHNLHRGRAEVRGMILDDITRFSDLGARRHAQDLEAVLLQFDVARRAPGPLTGPHGL